MNPMLVRCRRIAVLIALSSVLLVSLVASASAQDIAVTKSTNSTIVAADTDVSYDISVSNSSGVSGPTTLTDAVPANMTFVSASLPDGWNCTLPSVGSGGTISCTYPTALPDESVFFFIFVFHVVPGTPNGTVIINTATIANDSDPNSQNNSSPAMVTVGEPPPPPPPTPEVLPKDVLISEFRLSGPLGANDEYIEFYCNKDIDCDISGLTLRWHNPGGDNDTEFFMVFPPQTIIPARHYLLLGDGGGGSGGYSLAGYGWLDFDVHNPTRPDFFFDNEGIQLAKNTEPAAIIDSVGFTGGGSDLLYVEGTGLQRASSRPADQYAYVRKRTLATDGLPQDTDNNADDFVLVSVTGTTHEGITAPPVLGAPGPQGLTSPFSYSNSQVSGTLVDQTKSEEEDPNRVRVGVGDSGTLSIRRSFTNNTSDTFYYVSFRVIEIPTLNSPQTLIPPQAELRLVTSNETSAEVPSRGGPVTIYGTVLEYDNTCGCPEPKQPNGGGLNSTVSTFFSDENSIAPAETFDVQWLLNVVKAGSYRFYVYVEASGFPIFEDGATAPATATAVPRRLRSKPATARKFGAVQRTQIFDGGRKMTIRTPVIAPMTTTSPGRLTVPVRNAATPVPVRNAPTPRLVIINRGIGEGEKKPRRKTRIRKKNSAALKKKAEERFAAEKPQN